MTHEVLRHSCRVVVFGLEILHYYRSALEVDPGRMQGSSHHQIPLSPNMLQSAFSFLLLKKSSFHLVWGENMPLAEQKNGYFMTHTGKKKRDDLDQKNLKVCNNKSLDLEGFVHISGRIWKRL